MQLQLQVHVRATLHVHLAFQRQLSTLGADPISWVIGSSKVSRN
ncbi:hypothetical protein [Glutamicibacter creatinolyticus]